MKVLIVGAGIGGLSLAAFLNNEGIEYEIVEKSADWKHQGYSLSIWNNGRHILAKLGLAEIFDKSGKRIQNYYIYDGKGKIIRTYRLEDFYATYGIALTLINRGDLHDWLMSKIDNSKVTMNMSVESIIQMPDKTKVVFTDGSIKEYDLVVGADGIHSKIRNLVFQKDITKVSKWRVWYMWIDNKYRSEAAVTEYIEPAEFISIFDSGDKTLAIIAALSDNVIWDDPKGRIERLKQSFKDETTLVPQIFETLKDEEINPADLIHIRLKTWVNNRVVLLGDAAHGFEPHAGIGGSMALEDGYVLAGELMQVSEKYPLSVALRNYEIKRKKRVEIAWKLTHKMKAWALIRSKFIRRIVNFFIPYFPEWYFVKDYHALMKEEI
jgi:2-polyprenyl-6-methoxyphenol hydroxylase-like FAD-dependent oxidoreductase